MADNAHIYNLKAVINEVGLTPATLRAWESRYGLLRPQRSAGGHRLYSRQDIEMLKWLVARQKEGLSISQAVEMWKNQPGGDQEALRPRHATVSTLISGATVLDELRQSWLSACMVFDGQSADQVLDQAFAIASPQMVCLEVLQKGLAEVGERWYAGSASVQHEHFATALAVRRVNALITSTMPPSRLGRLLVACPPGEEHSFVLLLVTYLLRRHGWEVIYLGANMPIEDLEATIRAVSPALIISAAQTLTSAASLKRLADSARLHGVPLAFGGGIFHLLPTSAQSIAGFYLGNDISQVPQLVERLVGRPLIAITAKTLTPEYAALFTAFSQTEGLISAEVQAALRTRQLDPAHLETARIRLTELILAAITLGDIQLLEQPVSWLDGLLKNYGLPTTELNAFYQAYTQAVERNLGAEGIILVDWMEKHVLSAAHGS